MSWLTDFLVRPRPKHAADVVIARRIESDRAKAAAAHKARAERLAALSHAATLGRVTTPLRSRAGIAAEVQAEREARRISPASGGAEKGVMRGATPLQPEGAWGPVSSPVARDSDNHAGQSLSAGLFGGAS